jgi:hypothetical protein
LQAVDRHIDPVEEDSKTVNSGLLCLAVLVAEFDQNGILILISKCPPMQESITLGRAYGRSQRGRLRNIRKARCQALTLSVKQRFRRIEVNLEKVPKDEANPPGDICHIFNYEQKMALGGNWCTIDILIGSLLIR